jgi:hypothetical protein
MGWGGEGGGYRYVMLHYEPYNFITSLGSYSILSTSTNCMGLNKITHKIFHIIFLRQHLKRTASISSNCLKWAYSSLGEVCDFQAAA